MVIVEPKTWGEYIRMNRKLYREKKIDLNEFARRLRIVSNDTVTIIGNRVGLQYIDHEGFVY